jgi:cobalt-precorrin 5A hydrolase
LDKGKLDEAMIVAGVGCRRGASAEEISAAIASALAQAGLASTALDMIAAPSSKGDEQGIVAAASAIGVRLMLVSQNELMEAGARARTRSERVIALKGVPSVAEAAALAAAGPSARLLAGRIAIGPATCALATTEHP